MENKYPIPDKSQINQVLDLDIKEVPSFTPVMAKLLQVCCNDDTSVEELSKIAATDPGISLKIMGMVNRAAQSRRERILDVPEAVLYLGVDEVKRLALGTAVFETMFKAGRQKGFDRTVFWRHCLCVATLSQSIAEQTGFEKPGEAYVCGLLHDFGKIFFDLQGRVDYDDFVNLLSGNTGPLIDEERGLMGMGHDDLGAYYAKLWNLPDILTMSIHYHHRPFDNEGISRQCAQLISTVSLSNFLAWTQGMGSFDVIRPPVLQPEVRKFIDPARVNFKEIIDRMDQEMQKTAEFYNFVFPSASQFRENLLRANLDLCQISAPAAYGHKEPREPSTPPSFSSSITAPHRSLVTSEIIAKTLKAINLDFSFDRLYVLTIIKKTRRMKVVSFLDSSPSPMDLKHIEVPITENAGGFVKCLRKKIPVLIEGKNTIEQQTLSALKAKSIVVVPICSNDKVTGILGLDNATSGRPIPKEVISSIGIVAGELGMALENARRYNEARAESRRDSLTGLFNRLAINELLGKSFRNAVDGKHELCVVMMDIDYFKKFNDQFGHQTGDNVLKLIAATLKRMSRPFDHIGRYGGEEFIVVLNQTDQTKALAYAERIRREIEGLGQLLENRLPGLTLTISAGVSQYQTGIKNQDELVGLADKALYQAKQSGRNRVSYA